MPSRSRAARATWNRLSNGITPRVRARSGRPGGRRSIDRPRSAAGPRPAALRATRPRTTSSTRAERVGAIAHGMVVVARAVGATTPRSAAGPTRPPAPRSRPRRRSRPSAASSQPRPRRRRRSPPTDRGTPCSAEVDEDVLGLRVEVERAHPELAPDARHLVAAERRLGVDRAVRVDADDARPAAPSRRAAPCRCRGSRSSRDSPYGVALARRSASSSVSNGMIDTTGPKISSRAMRMSFDTPSKTVGRRYAPSARAGSSGAVAADDDRRAFAEPDLDVVLDPVALLGADERADLGRLVGRVADLDLARRLGEQLDDAARGPIARRGSGSARSSPGPRCRRRCTATRARTSRGRRRRRRCWGSCRRARARSSSRCPTASRMISWPVVVSPVNATLPMPGWAAIEAPAVPPGPGHDVEDAGRDAGLERQLAEPDRGQRRVRRGLEDRGVAGGQRRRDLPRGHQDREVPGHDQPDDADRLAQGQVDARAC